MKIQIFAVSYNSIVASPFLSLISNFLSNGFITDSETIIKAIDVYPHFKSKKKIQDLKLMSERFEERIKNLPLCWFRRKKNLFEIAYYSQVCSVEDIEKTEKFNRLNIFRGVCTEIAQSMELIKKRINIKDKFDYSSFDLHLKSCLKLMPSTNSELKILMDKQRHSSQS
jgi:hypothetical protein